MQDASASPVQGSRAGNRLSPPPKKISGPDTTLNAFPYPHTSPNRISNRQYPPPPPPQTASQPPVTALWLLRKCPESLPPLQANAVVWGQRSNMQFHAFSTHQYMCTVSLCAIK